MSSGQQIWLTVARLYDFEGTNDVTRPGDERLEVTLKSETNLLGYEATNDISVFSVSGTNALISDGHVSGRLHTRLLAELEEGSYQVTFVVGHPTLAVGPVTLSVGGHAMPDAVTVEAGQVLTLTLCGGTVSNQLAIDLDNGTNAIWALCGLEIDPIDGTGEARVWNENYETKYLWCDFVGTNGGVYGHETVPVVEKGATNVVGWQSTNEIETFSGGYPGTVGFDGHVSSQTLARLVVDVGTSTNSFYAGATFGHPTNATGPFDVALNGAIVASNLTVAARGVYYLQASCVATNGQILLDIVNAQTSLWALCGIQLSEERPEGIPFQWTEDVETALVIPVKAGLYDMSGGGARITVPDGLPVPQTNDVETAGYVEVKAPAGVIAEISAIAGRVITVNADHWDAGRVWDLRYAPVDIGATGRYDFVVETCGRGGVFRAIEEQPGNYCWPVGEPDHDRFGDDTLLDEDPAMPELPAPPPAEAPVTEVPEKGAFRLQVVCTDEALAVLANPRLRTLAETEEITLDADGVSEQVIVAHLEDMDEETEDYFAEQETVLLKLAEPGQTIFADIYRGGSEHKVGDSGQETDAVVMIAQVGVTRTVLNGYYHSNNEIGQLLSPRYSMRVETKVCFEATYQVKDGERYDNAYLEEFKLGLLLFHPRSDAACHEGSMLLEDCEVVSKDPQTGMQPKVTLRFSKLAEDGGSQDLVAGDFAGERLVLMVLLPPDESPPSEEYYTGTALLDTRSGYSINCAAEKAGNFEQIVEAFYGAGGLGADYPGRTVPDGYNGESQEAFNGADENRHFDGADLPMELSHGEVRGWSSHALGFIHRRSIVERKSERHFQALLLRSMTLGRNDAEWPILQSCLLFRRADLLDPHDRDDDMRKVSWEMAVKELSETVFANGVHVLLGYTTKAHSYCGEDTFPPKDEKIDMDGRFADFATALKSPETVLRDAWLNTMAIDTHTYKGETTKTRPIVIGCKLKDKNGKKAFDDMLPTGPEVKEISADMRTRGSADIQWRVYLFPDETQ